MFLTDRRAVSSQGVKYAELCERLRESGGNRALQDFYGMYGQPPGSSPVTGWVIEVGLGALKLELMAPPNPPTASTCRP